MRYTLTINVPGDDPSSLHREDPDLFGKAIVDLLNDKRTMAAMLSGKHYKECSFVAGGWQ